MYGLIISVIFGVIIAIVTSRDLGTAWGIVCGFGIMMITQLIIGLLLRRKIGQINRDIEEIMRTAQEKINAKMNLYQMRPPGNPRMAMQSLEKMQKDAVEQCLKATEKFTPLYRWNFLLKKQTNTMKLQLLYMNKEFGKVDELLPKCLLLDARSLAIKLIRLYRNNDQSLDKFYDKKCRKLKGENAALLASTYAWIKLKTNEPAKATAALVAARKYSDNATLVENCDRLVNGKFQLFSNDGLGEQWYSLYLEEKKVKPIRQNRPRMF